MDFSCVIRPEIIQLDLEAHAKADALNKMAEQLLEAGAITSVEAYLEAVYEREKEGSTGIGNGIAIPHGKSDSILKTSVAFARLRTPIEWETLDDAPVQMIFLFAVPNSNQNIEHLKLLSQLATCLAREETLASLERAASPESIVEIFEKQELELR